MTNRLINWIDTFFVDTNTTLYVPVPNDSNEFQITNINFVPDISLIVQFTNKLSNSVQRLYVPDTEVFRQISFPILISKSRQTEISLCSSCLRTNTFELDYWYGKTRRQRSIHFTPILFLDGDLTNTPNLFNYL